MSAATMRRSVLKLVYQDDVKHKGEVRQSIKMALVETLIKEPIKKRVCS